MRGLNETQGLGILKDPFPSFPASFLPSRAVESMLQAGHSDVVLVDTMDEMPSLADIQLAHLKLRNLCLPGENNLWTLNRNLVYYLCIIDPLAH